MTTTEQESYAEYEAKVKAKVEAIDARRAALAKQKEFKQQHKRWLRTLDVLFIIAIIFHLGAGFLTNLSVAKVIHEGGGELRITEGNPVQAEAQNLEPSPGGWKTYLFAMIVIVSEVIIIVGYVYLRLTVKGMKGLATLTALTVGVFYFHTWNFLNDLSLYFGMRLW